MTQLSPVARRHNLVIKELTDETLIYDLDSDQAHCLNQTAALVWKNCDGVRTPTEIAQLVEETLRAPINEDVVWLALDQLEQFRLLQGPVTKPVPLLSRRRLMRNLGLAAAVSIPAITSIVAPTPAQAASCNSVSGRDIGCPCTVSAQCTTNCCRSGECKPGGGSCA
jgi:Coenzyme PQQ synthesis protein D (PqqD)